jgi:RNA polymerase sigma-70 factor (ECF subfamily)
MSSGKTDEEIIFLHKKGDGEALKILIKRYASPLYNFTARLTGQNNAPDAVQEIFIKVWKNIDNFDSRKASFKTWIFTIAKNTTTDFLRKKKNLLFSDLESARQDLAEENKNTFAENIPDESLLPNEILQKLEDSQFLNTLLQKLRPDYQEILVLHYQEEMTFEEIGKILGKPLNTVKSSHRRAIIELRKMIGWGLIAPS